MHTGRVPRGRRHASPPGGKHGMSDDADAARPPRMRGMRHAGCTATGPAAATRATVRLPALSHACMAYALFGESRMRLRYGMGGHRACRRFCVFVGVGIPTLGRTVLFPKFYAAAPFTANAQWPIRVNRFRRINRTEHTQFTRSGRDFDLPRHSRYSGVIPMMFQHTCSDGDG